MLARTVGTRQSAAYADRFKTAPAHGAAIVHIFQQRNGQGVELATGLSTLTSMIHHMQCSNAGDGT